MEIWNFVAMEIWNLGVLVVLISCLVLLREPSSFLKDVIGTGDWGNLLKKDFCTVPAPICYTGW